MNFLILVLLTISNLEKSDTQFLQPEYKIHIYPKEFHLDAPVYFSIDAKNVYDSPIFVFDEYKYKDDFVVTLYNTKAGLSYVLTTASIDFNERSRRITYVPILPGESRRVVSTFFQLMSPEKANNSIWQEFIETCDKTTEGLLLDFKIISKVAPKKFGLGFSRKNVRFTYQVIPDLSNSKSNFSLGEVCDKEIIEDKVISARFCVNAKETNKEGSNFISIEDQAYPLWLFATQNFLSSRKVFPSSWQGWKELEESLTSGTMRDEIRLTRIIIQYCDTSDEKVLNELKEWFAEMNEIQRSYMAQSIWKRSLVSPFFDIVLVPSFCDIYRTIREYDISAKSENELEHLKNLRLLE